MKPVVRHPGEYRWETRLLAVVTATMVVFGLVSSYAASSIVAGGETGADLALKQLIGALIGGVLLIALARIDYRLWRTMAWPLLLISLGMLLVLFLPLPGSIVPTLNGARRWIDLGPATFQPSEVARITLVIWCAMLAAKKGSQVRDLKKGVLPFLLIIGITSGLILLEPNMSMAVLVGLVGMIVVFAAGARIGHIILLIVAVAPIAAHQFNVEYRLKRIVAFMNPSDVTSAAGDQLHQSLIGFGTGGIFGVGFGEGQQKLGFLAYAYSDFILSVIGEEWGLIGVLVVVMLFGVFCWLGFRIARTATDPFGQFLAVGLTAAIGVAAIIHMVVTLGLMPTTGVSLPFMSAGGSGLVVSMAATGILINIGRQRGRPAPSPPLERGRR